MHTLRSLVASPESLRMRLFRASLLVMLVAACAYRVWLVFRFNPVDQIWSDAGLHWQQGIRPLDTSPMAAVDPILYQVYIAVLAKLTVKSPVLVAYWTSLLSLSGPWLWYRFLRELTSDRDIALVGWVALAALPSWSSIYSYFMQETLMLPLLGGALWATWRCRRKADTPSFVVAVAMWLLAGLTRGICFPLAAVAMVWLWMAQPEKTVKAAASMLLLLACLGPLAGRSWSIARLISPHGIGQVAQLYQLAGTSKISFDFTRGQGREHWYYEFTSPSVSHPPFAPLSSWRTRRESIVNFTIDLDAGRRDWQAAKDILPPYSFSRASWLVSENLIHLFFGPSWPDTDIEGNLRRDVGKINYWMRWIWAPMTVLALIVLVLTWRRQNDRLMPALLLTWFVIQGLFPLSVNEGRYRKPFEGLLIAQCLLLVGAQRRISRSEQRKPVVASSPGLDPAGEIVQTALTRA